MIRNCIFRAQRAKKREFANLFSSLSHEKHEFLNETLQGQKEN